MLFMWRLERAIQVDHLYCVSNTARGGKDIDLPRVGSKQAVRHRIPLSL
jgi:hypothetical protein